MTDRTTLTDGQARTDFLPCRPATYTLTFELAGLAQLVREGIHVGLGFTATVNAEISPGTVSDSVTVSGSPVVDLASTEVTTHFDSEKLASLPGARDIFAILANTPGVALSKMDVGGNGALSLQDYTAYGLRATTGVNRNEVEGIRVGGANGANDNYFSDFASFAEIAIKAVGQTAAMPVPGTLGAVRQQVRRQRLSRQRLRGFPERRAGGDQHRRRARSRAACPAGPASTRGT